MRARRAVLNLCRAQGPPEYCQIQLRHTCKPPVSPRVRANSLTKKEVRRDRTSEGTMTTNSEGPQARRTRRGGTVSSSPSFGNPSKKEAGAPAEGGDFRTPSHPPPQLDVQVGARDFACPQWSWLEPMPTNSQTWPSTFKQTPKAADTCDNTMYEGETSTGFRLPAFVPPMERSTRG